MTAQLPGFLRRFLCLGRGTRWLMPGTFQAIPRTIEIDSHRMQDSRANLVSQPYLALSFMHDHDLW